MSAPQKRQESQTKKVCRTPAQDRLKRLRGTVKKMNKPTNRSQSDCSDKKKSKRGSSKISHRLSISDSIYNGRRTCAFDASFCNDAKDDATASSSSRQQQTQQTTSVPVIHATTHLQLQQTQQQQTTSKNSDELLVLPSSKTKRRLSSNSLLIEQNPNVSSKDDESLVTPQKRKRREETNFSPNEGNPPCAAKPFQEQKQNIAGAAARADAADTNKIFINDRKSDDVTDFICIPNKIDQGVDDAYLRENLIITKRSFNHMVMNNRTSSSLNGLDSSKAADTDTPVNSSSNSFPNQSVFSNENQNYKDAIKKSNIYSSTKNKLKILLEKPTCAIIKKFQSLNGFSSTSSKSLANDRLNRYRFSLQQEQQKQQQNVNNNETFVPTATTLSPSNSNYADLINKVNKTESSTKRQSLPCRNSNSISIYWNNSLRMLLNAKEYICAKQSLSNLGACEAMDWQSSEGNDNLNELSNDDGVLSTRSSTSNVSNRSVHNLDSPKFIIKDVMSVDTKGYSLPPRKQNHMYFVLDTNILLSYIVFVEELTKISLYEETVGNILFIPYKVIQELDNIKHRGTDSNRKRASRAIRFLNDKLDSDDIQGQTAIAERKHLIHVDSPDDSIINCCLQLKKEVQHMMLLTDDGNMLLKARVNGILATTKSDLTYKFQSKFLSLDENKIAYF